MSKKYISNYSSFITIVCAHTAILAISYFERGGFKIDVDPVVIILFFGLPLFGLLLDWRTWLSISDKQLISSGQFDIRGPESVEIHTIKQVRRVRQNTLIPHMGSFISFNGDDGHLMHVREANYSTKTIKQFMTDLKEKLPFAEFDPQYEELIAKSLDDLPGFKRTPATHSSFD